MFGLRAFGEVIGNFGTKLDNLFGEKNNQRADNTNDFFNLFTQNGGFGYETDFLQPQVNIYGSNSLFTGVQDYTINAADVHQMVNQDTYFSSLLKTAEEQIFVKGGYFEAQKRRIPELEAILEDNQVEKLLRKIFKYDFADGGGNWILYPKNRQIVVDPFWAEGFHRAKVFGNDDTREIEKVQILSRARGYLPIFEVDLTKNNRFIHLGRYENGGHYLFSSNPAKRAVFWWMVKKYPAIMSPAYDKMAAMVKAFSEQRPQVSGGGDNLTQKFTNDFIKNFAQNADLTKEILKEATGARNNNKLIYLKSPVDITTIGRDNKSMESLELLRICNEEISFACGIGRGILDAEHSKFNNAEQMRDNFMNFVVKPYQRKFEKLLNEVILPFYSPEFRARDEKYIFGKEIGEEDIEIYKAKTERISSQADIITKLNGTNYKLNLETMEIEENVQTLPKEKGKEQITQKKIKETEIEDQIENKDNQRVDKKNLTETALESGKFSKFNNSLQNAITKQIKDYIDKLESYNDTQTAIDNFDKDFKPISQFGLGVQPIKSQLVAFAKMGTESVQKELGKQKRDDINEIPAEILEILDIQSQILVKGWNSLKDSQMEIAEKFFPQPKTA